MPRKWNFAKKNHLWLLSTCLGLWFEVKTKWGHLRIIFLTSGYRDPEVKNIFVNVSAKTKYFRKYFSMWIQGPGTIDSWKNQRSKISRYSPFKNFTHRKIAFKFWMDTFKQIFYWGHVKNEKFIRTGKPHMLCAGAGNPCMKCCTYNFNYYANYKIGSLRRENQIFYLNIVNTNK